MNVYNQYNEQLNKIADVAYASAVLMWDQETYMPAGGADFRAGQLATLSGLHHDLITSPKLEELVKQLIDDKSLSPEQHKNVEVTLKDLTKKKKYTTAFVEKQSLAVSRAFNSWQDAKKKNDFKIYANDLEALINLKKEECEIIGYQHHPYNALLDEYEPGITIEKLDKVFEDVRGKLVPFIKQLFTAKQNSNSFLFESYNKDQQWSFTLQLLKKMGYDFNRGRQDISEHPFTISFSSQDVRVTTRVNENDLAEIIWGSIHEGGHALYEQGLLTENYGLPAGEACSLGIHESQSRLWENNVGRALPFWKANYPLLQSTFPQQLKDVTLDDFYKAINLVEPSLIRTSANELTYHLHVLIRYEIEKQIFNNAVSIKDLPELWNAKYKEYLNIDVPDDSQGILQDVHWSHGSFGYFPTYSLGSFYAAQFYNQAKKSIANLEVELEKGNTSLLLAWLRKEVHPFGRLLTAEELSRKVTGEGLNFNYFFEYVQKKYSNLYSL